MTRPLLRAPSSVRSAKRLLKRRPEAREALRETLLRLEQDVFDPRLRTHRLKGDLAGWWACSVSYDIRIVFRFEQRPDGEAIILVALGTHDEAY